MECVFYQILSDKIECLLKDYVEKKVFDDNKVNEIHTWIECRVDDPCMECASCYDFRFYYDLFIKLKSEKIDITELKHNLQYWEKVKIYDKCLDFLSEHGSGINFDKNKVFKNYDNKKIVYIDHNILIDYAIDKEFRKKIDISKNNFQYCFSSSHLNEIIKIKDGERKKLLLNAIASLTDNIGVYELDNRLTIVRVDLGYIKEIEKIQNIAIELGEAYRQIQINDNKIFFDKYTVQSFSKKINNEGVFILENCEINKLLQHVSCQYSIEDMKETKFEKASDVNHIIYSLFNVFNILGYKVDRKKDTIISSAHDIEHIKFASICDIFVTNDSRLCDRSKEIYKFIKSNTMTVSKQRLLEIIKPCFKN